MFRIVRNLWIDQYRRNRTAGPRENIEDHPELAGPRGEAEVLARIELGEVGQALDRLPPDQREVLVLVCIEEYSYKETAALLDLPVGTVMSRLARARKHLGNLLGISPGLERSSGDREKSDEQTGY